MQLLYYHKLLNLKNKQKDKNMNRNERILITKLAFPDWTINDPLENKIQREMWTIKEKDDFVLIASNPRDINKDTWEDYSIAFHCIAGSTRNARRRTQACAEP